MKIFIVSVFIILHLLFSSYSYTQQWNESIHFNDFENIQFQWRVLRKGEENKFTMFEWSFSNISDSTVSFNYIIMSNRNDQRIGRLILKPQSKKLFGWLFEADSITEVQVTDVQFIK
jgi:hypothetical protein